MRNTALKLAILGLLALSLSGLRLTAQTSLIATGAVWKYLDDGSDQGTNWVATNFNDSVWLEGPAELGYGDAVDGRTEATLVNFGGDTNAKFITTYFRRTINIANPAGITNLLLRVLRDDGVVVYLNGTEIFRDNMPAGAISYTNLATVAATDDGTNYLPAALSPALLVAGSNTVAVEIHQSAANSSDISFDLSLTGNYVPEVPVAAITSPTNTQTVAGAVLNILVTATDGDGSVTNVEFFEGANLLGTDAAAPFNFVWSGIITGAYTLRAVAVDSTGLRGTSAPVSITVVAAPAAIIVQNAIWKYRDTGQDLGTTWTALDFDDSAWASGPAELGYGDGDEATAVSFGGDAQNKFTTTYFRHRVVVPNPAIYTTLALTVTYDDGAVVYINGTEAHRVGMPAGAVTFAQFASAAADYSPDTVNLPTSALVAGTNIVAVEVHQGNLTSSDVSMALRLVGVIPPSAIITSPTEGQTINLPATVTMDVSANDPDGSVATVDFYRSGAYIGSDATAPYSAVLSNLVEGVYALTAVVTDDGGASSTSAPVNITVVDPNPPTIVAVQAQTNLVTVTFSKKVAPPGATNGANYAINNGISVLGAAYGSSSNVVILSTSFITPGTTNILTVNSVADLGGTPIVPNSQISFAVTAFVYADVGAPMPAGTTTGVPGGFDLAAGGAAGLDGTADQFHFNYREFNGDFDVATRVQSLTMADTWTKAGLMARETLAAGSRFYSSTATPRLGGNFFQFRTNLNGATLIAGSAPALYPNNWLRLKRTGNSFAGYFSADGNSWMLLSSIANQTTLPNTMLVGMFVTSRTNGIGATAQFRDFTDIAGTPPLASLSLAREPVGPSSRRTGFAITEVMYHPREIAGSPGRSLEFIEILNTQAFPEELGRHRISGAIDFAFPSSYVVKPGQLVVIARDPAFVTSHYGISGVLGPWAGTNMAGISTNSLPGGQGTIRLRNPADAVLLEVNYQGANPWPIAADGAGHSLVLSKPSYGEGSPKSWAASDSIDGSPGGDEPFSGDPMSAVVINEILVHTDLPLLDSIELYNHSRVAVNVSGAWLSDEADTNKFRIPNGTIIGPTGFVFFTETQLGFALSAAGERVYLVNSNQNRVIDAVDFGPQANGVSLGRYPCGAPAFYPQVSRTPGSANSGPLLSPVVINEIMYSPITGNEDDEYIELYNRSGGPVDLGRWKIVDGVSFTFPVGTMLSNGNYLVVARNRTNLLARHPGVLNAGNTLGNFNGSLANGGERVALAMPEFIVSTNTNTMTLITNLVFVTVNEVTYGDGGRWGYWADGGGSSLELTDPDSDNRQADNWADSDESAKATWTSIEVTGNIVMVRPVGGSPDRLFVFQQGIGECLVDDVEVRVSGGANLVANPGFESDLTGWTLQGSHDQSTIENVGFGGTKSLHLRATSRGDNGPNRVRTTITGVAGTSVGVTLRAKVKWLRGWPEVLLYLNGGGLECPGPLALPANLGSPGARNSRAVTNAGPAIYSVVHSPALPAAGENVVVTARVTDPDGVSSLAVKYRVDATTVNPYVTVSMADNGVAPDAVAGDGVYSATVPGQVTGAAVAFYLEAVDAAGGGMQRSNTFPRDVFPPAGLVRCFPFDSMTKECVIRWGDRQMAGSFATYHLWLTLHNAQRWDARENLNNGALDGTFVYNNYRVVYNARPQFAGSPWHEGAMAGGPTNNNNRVDYVCNFPEDDRFLGVTDTVLNTVGNPEGNHGTDNSGQSEQTSYLIFREMGIQYNHRRYMHLFINGNQRSVGDNIVGGLAGTWMMEDSQQPNSDMIEEWYPDDTDGDFYKIEDWFLFNDGGSRADNEDADLGRREQIVNGTNTLHIPAYRYMWRKRAVGPGESANDYSQFAQLVNIVSPTAAYSETATNSVPNPDALMDFADMEQWMQIAAVQHAVGNWDAYFYERGKNAYTYKPKNGRFAMWTWDIDFTVGVGGNGSGTSLFALGGDGDRRVQGMWNTPVILRMYWRAYEKMMNGVWNNTVIDPILDAKARAMADNRIGYQPGTVTTIKTFIGARRTYILGQLATVASGFNVAGPTSFSTNNNLITLSGTAPVSFRYIYLNGVQHPVTWTSVTGWTARVVIGGGVNSLVLQGSLIDGTLTTSNRTVTVTYTGPPVEPVGSVAFNELLYQPRFPDTSFVELFNSSLSNSFDMGGWRINGLDFDFAPGTILGPRQFAVVTKSTPAFVSAFGGGITPVGEFNGSLDPGGETLTLLKPATTNTPEVVIDKLRYEPQAPWASMAAGSGASLQLIDSRQDNSRVSNWDIQRNGWLYYSYTGTISANNTTFIIFLTSSVADLYLDDITLVTGPAPEAGPNLLQNGGFEAPLSGTWTNLGNHSNSVASTDFARTGTRSLHVIAAGNGGAGSNVRQIIPAFTTNTQCTVSFWFRPKTNATFLNVRTTPANTFNLGNFNAQGSPVVADAGATNSVNAILPAYDPVWLNELQAENVSGPMDNAGEREPWVELYNAGTNTVDLSGYYLANNYGSNLTQWQFPAGYSLAPGEFRLVWADGETNEIAGTNAHTNFRLPVGNGTLALVRLASGLPQITDYLSYTNLGASLAYGDFPDGQPFSRRILQTVTPRGTNSSQDVTVFINEWMADNGSFLLDPIDFNYDDWFELYNPGDTAVDLSDYYLTDDLGDPTKFHIPNNGHYVIPPGGFLLVWADNDSNDNSTNSADLHASFSLSADPGEAIGLYAPDGSTLVDSITFLRQTNNISEGRYADGAINRFFMSTPTPRASNVIPGGNTPPNIAAIADRVVRLGQTVSFMASATDAEAPPQTLAFSLGGTPPMGAMITAGGLFTWTPSAMQTPSTNDITVVVTDNGPGLLPDSDTFTVTVRPPPVAMITGGGTSVSFDTIPGRSYRLEYKNNIDDPVWLPLNAPILATGDSMTITDNTGVTAQRFYRVYQVD